MRNRSLPKTIEIFGPALITGLSIAILGIVFAAQYWGGLQPCHLCWLERYPYMVTILLGALACLLQWLEPARIGWRSLMLLSGVAFLVGGGIAVYHVGVEQHWWLGPESCTSTINNVADLTKLLKAIMTAPVVRCDEPAWTFLGISMAGFNVLASAGLMLISFSVVPSLWALRRR